MGLFNIAWGGIASLSLGASIVNTVLRDLPALVRLMAFAPAALAGVDRRKGRIAEGFDADLMVFAPDEPFRVMPDDLHFRHAISPYVGEHLTGRVQQTILRGNVIFVDGRFAGQPLGREVRA